jgi:hypothetical protein
VVAVAWTLHNPAITAAIVGGRSASRWKAWLPALTFRLSEEEFAGSTRFWLQSGVRPLRLTRIEAKTPAEAGVLFEGKSRLHRCDKVGNHDGRVFLQQLRHAGGHAGVH